MLNTKQLCEVSVECIVHVYCQSENVPRGVVEGYGTHVVQTTPIAELTQPSMVQ